MNQLPYQRLRVTYAQGEAIKYISHMDLARAWERALRRAGVPLAHSQGFNPRPKMTFAAALPVGVTGEREVMDLILFRPVMPLTFGERLAPHLPPGLKVIQVEEVYFKLPSLQSLVRAADYRLEVDWAGDHQTLQARLAGFLAAGSISRERRGRSYDLRPLVISLHLGEALPGGYALYACLRQSQSGTGRHDELLYALDLADALRAASRQRLYFEPGI